MLMYSMVDNNGAKAYLRKLKGVLKCGDFLDWMEQVWEFFSSVECFVLPIGKFQHVSLPM